jgi:hypothetical protein
MVDFQISISTIVGSRDEPELEIENWRLEIEKLLHRGDFRGD